MALKELQIRYATKRAKGYKLTNGEGLYLLVRPNGSKLWRMTYRYGGKEKLLSFGAHPAVSRAAPWPKWCWARGGGSKRRQQAQGADDQKGGGAQMAWPPPRRA